MNLLKLVFLASLFSFVFGCSTNQTIKNEELNKTIPEHVMAHINGFCEFYGNASHELKGKMSANAYQNFCINKHLDAIKSTLTN